MMWIVIWFEIVYKLYVYRKINYRKGFKFYFVGGNETMGNLGRNLGFVAILEEYPWKSVYIRRKVEKSSFLCMKDCCSHCNI